MGVLEDLHEQVSRAVRDAVASGFKAPLHLVVIGANGTMLYFGVDEFVEEPAPTLLSRFERGAGFELPIHVLIVDARGESARVVVKRSGPRAIEYLN